MKTDAFLTCSCCGFTWKSRKEFLADETLKLNGYQVNLLSLEDGLFLFTHNVQGCCTTLAVKVNEFSDMHTGENYTERRTDQEDCPGYCRNEKFLGRCEAKCECAYVRNIIQVIRKD